MKSMKANAKPWRETFETLFTPSERKEIEAEGARLAELSSIRKRRGVTQVELAGAMDITQGALSQMERKKDPLISTLARYIEHLGGNLRLVADFGSESLEVDLGLQSRAPLKKSKSVRRAK